MGNVSFREFPLLACAICLLRSRSPTSVLVQRPVIPFYAILRIVILDPWCTKVWSGANARIADIIGTMQQAHAGRRDNSS